MSNTGIIANRTNIVVFHGSVERVVTPELRELSDPKDFGKGFYVTTDFEQAKRFAFSRMADSIFNVAYVNQYEVESFDGLDILEFETADEAWFDFIMDNRNTANGVSYSHDIVIGKIADDRTRRILLNYMDRFYADEAEEKGISEKEVAISKLKPWRLTNQLCFHTERAISRLLFTKATAVR